MGGLSPGRPNPNRSSSSSARSGPIGKEHHWVMQIDFRPDKKLFPFESKWFDGAGPRVHYVDEGAGLPVVMFHGNPTWSFLYRKVIGELKGGFRCIAMDYPGFGL